MDTSSSGLRYPLDALFLDRQSKVPLYKQLEKALRQAIGAGLLRPGERLPSSRRLAEDHNIGRNTVINAYEQLTVEGYLESVHGSGTRVATTLPAYLLKPQGQTRASSGRDMKTFRPSVDALKMRQVDAWTPQEPIQRAQPFRAHTPCVEAFPWELWTRLYHRRLRNMPTSDLESADSRGYGPLRRAIADYLGPARGVSCGAEQVTITAGTQQAVELLAKILIEPGDVVSMEEPGYSPAGILFESAGARVVPVPVDDEGIDVEELRRRAPRAKLLYVTPGSHFPLGSTLSFARRLSLLEWAQEADAWILEDDYSGEYRYSGRPLPALHGLDPTGRVIYLGTFSKLLFPTLRLGYVVAPPSLGPFLGAARWLHDRHSPLLDQGVLFDFLDQGHFARHLGRMRKLYARRRAALVETVAEELGDIFRIPAIDCGLHLIGRLAPRFSETDLIRAAASAGVELATTTELYAEPPDRAEAIFGFAPFTREATRDAARALKQALSGG